MLNTKIIDDTDSEDDSRELLVIVPARQDALAVFTSPGGVEPLLAMVRAKIDAFEGDPATPKGRKEIKSFANKIVKAKTALEDVGKALADEQKKIPGKIDAARRLLKETLDAWRDEVRKPVDEWEETERLRVEMHRLALLRIEALGRPGDIPSEQMRANLEELLAISTDVETPQLSEKYANAKAEAEWSLRSAIEKREKHEAEQAELARLRAEAADRARKDREEELRREGEERARREAEEKLEAERRKAEDNRKKAEADRLAAARREEQLRQEKEEAEKRAKEAAEKAERDLKEKQEKERAAELAEQQRREANARHRGKINRAAADALISHGIDEETAKFVIKLIVNKSIPAVSIAY